MNTGDGENQDMQSDSNKSIVKIEIYFEENVRIVNIVDVPVNKKIDISNFNIDTYLNLTSNNSFLKEARLCIEKSNDGDWRYDIHRSELDIMGDQL